MPYIKRFYYNRIDVSEGIDVNKNAKTSKNCVMCQYWYFLNKCCRFQSSVFNDFHDILMSLDKITLLYQMLKVLIISALYPVTEMKQLD